MKQNTKTWKFTITKKILNHVKEKLVKNEIKKNIIRHPEGKWLINNESLLMSHLSIFLSVIQFGGVDYIWCDNSRWRRLE